MINDLQKTMKFLIFFYINVQHNWKLDDHQDHVHHKLQTNTDLHYHYNL